jgi:hypothetical protein
VDYLSKPHPAEVGLLCVLTECVRTETQSVPGGLYAHGLNVYEENIHKVIVYPYMYAFIQCIQMMYICADTNGRIKAYMCI